MGTQRPGRDRAETERARGGTWQRRGTTRAGDRPRRSVHPRRPARRVRRRAVLAGHRPHPGPQRRGARARRLRPARRRPARRSPHLGAGHRRPPAAGARRRLGRAASSTSSTSGARACRWTGCSPRARCPPRRAAWVVKEVAEAIVHRAPQRRRPRPAAARERHGHRGRLGQADRLRRRRGARAGDQHRRVDRGRPVDGPRGRRHRPRRAALRRPGRPVARHRRARRSRPRPPSTAARCARARCGPAYPARWTRSASGCWPRRRTTRTPCRS